MKPADAKVVVSAVQPGIGGILPDERRPFLGGAVVEAGILQSGGRVEVADRGLTLGVVRGGGPGAARRQQPGGPKHAYDEPS